MTRFFVRMANIYGHLPILKEFLAVAPQTVDAEGNFFGMSALCFSVMFGHRPMVDWLVERGIDSDRLVSKGYGFDRPLLPHPDPQSTVINRRVEFTVLRSDEVPEDARLPSASELPAP